MIHILFVAAGGALGALARYGVATWLAPASSRIALPWGTIAVNLLGCLVIGVLMGLAQTRDGLSEGVRTFLMIGILGGFTTFSAFGLETVSLIRAGAASLVAANLALQVGGGLLAVWVGWAMST
ncbi:MAG: fluoride efflux transporter CrcB [Gemmatimonadota bacterium]|nr:fluoride efflux transporter CrcB [Gemmatimonadota bacterium]